MLRPRQLSLEGLRARANLYLSGWLDRLLAKGKTEDGTLTVEDADWRAALAENLDPAKAAAHGLGGCGGCGG